MGCQGEIYVVYGVQVEAKCEWEAGVEKNPVIYSINGHTLCDDEDFMGCLENPEDEHGKPLRDCPKEEVEFFNGIPSMYYGASDMDECELVMRVLGHSGEYGCGNMGARHFSDDFGKKKVGRKGKALVGYVVGNECYLNSAVELPGGEKVRAQAPRLVAEIKEKLGLDIKMSQLGAHLLFEELNGL